MQVPLSPRSESLVRDLLERGEYGSAAEAVDAGLRLLGERGDASLCRDVALGIEQVLAGESDPLDAAGMKTDVKAALRERLAQGA